MSSSIALSPEVVAYLAWNNPPEHPVLRRCREETLALGPVSGMQISPEQGAFMQWLARLTGAKRAIEVGVFTGYSSLAVALTMMDMHGSDARILGCDISAEWTARAKGYWLDAGVDGVIDLRVAPATQTLDAEISRGGAGYDLAFIDADKTGYDAYYERCLALLRPGGAMLFDNMLWGGKVADPGVNDADTAALRALNAKARHDSRVHAALTALGDGLLLCMKR